MSKTLGDTFREMEDHLFSVRTSLMHARVTTDTPPALVEIAEQHRLCGLQSLELVLDDLDDLLQPRTVVRDGRRDIG